METLFSPLILTKYCIPKQHSRLVSRQPLIEKLASWKDKDLIVISAPAGYGKTTLLVEWCESLADNVSIAWYSLDEGDDNVLIFGSYLAASFTSAIGAGHGLEQIWQLLRTSPEIDLQKIIPGLINAAASHERNMVFVLDDYHLITNPAIHRAVTFLLEHLPANLCLAIGSRSDPPIPLARLRARGKLLEIRTADLQFSLKETTQFLNSIMQLELSLEMIAELETRTEGWVAGLQLATISLAGRNDREAFIHSFSGGQRFLVEYLLDEVMNHQSEEVRSFLLRTSILERLNGSLCDAITGRETGGKGILASLERENHFIVALDDEGGWYRYHHLFREFLLNRLNIAQHESINALYRAAAGWEAAHGYLREAVQYAILSKDWDYAASLVEQNGVVLMLHGDYATMHGWCAVFPEEVMQTHPTLCLFQSNALVLNYQRMYRELIEKRLFQVEQASTLMTDVWLARLFCGQAAVTRTLLAAVIPDPEADPRKHFALAGKALDLISEDDPGRSAVGLATGYAYMALNKTEEAYFALEETRQFSVKSESYFAVVEAAFHQARIAHNQGQLHRVVDICRQARDEISTFFSQPDEDLSVIGCLDIAEGCVDLEQNRLNTAEKKITHGLKLIGWGMNPFYQMTACTALFHLYEIQNRSEQALELLNHLDEIWPDITFLTDGLRLLHTLRVTPDNPAERIKATSWIQYFYSSFISDHPLPGFGPFGGAEVFYQSRLVWIRLQMSLGEISAARSVLEPLLQQALETRLVNRIIELSLLEALIAYLEGDTHNTIQAMERALRNGEREGFLRIFDSSSMMRGLLAKAGSEGICSNYVQHLLAVFMSYKTTPSGQHGSDQGLIEPLSGRELEVLRKLAQGVTNQEIAAQLVITVGTVKSHINHILKKLGAQNRTEAAARARDLNLL